MAHLHYGSVTAGPENDAVEFAAVLEPTPLERQQLAISDSARHTFWHWVRFDVVARVVTRAGVDTVVDIGAGSGMLGDWLRERHPSIGYRFQELSSTSMQRLSTSSAPTPATPPMHRFAMPWSPCST